MTSGQFLRRSFETDVVGTVEYLIKWFGKHISSRGGGEDLREGGSMRVWKFKTLMAFTVQIDGIILKKCLQERNSSRYWL